MSQLRKPQKSDSKRVNVKPVKPQNNVYVHVCVCIYLLTPTQPCISDIVLFFVLQTIQTTEQKSILADKRLLAVFQEHAAGEHQGADTLMISG